MEDYFENLYFEGEYVAYSPYGATQDEAMNFYELLTKALTKIGEGEEATLPEGTRLHGLTDFVAFKMPTGAKALYNLGYRTGKYKEKTEEKEEYCYIIHPNKKHIVYAYSKQQPLIEKLWIGLAKIESQNRKKEMC